MKFVLGYRTELFMIFLVPIRALRWYRLTNTIKIFKSSDINSNYTVILLL